MKQPRGRLINLEGIDQAGKKTQMKMLVKQLRASKYYASAISFPDYTTTVGRLIKFYLSGSRRLDLHSLHMLYAANRWEHAAEMARKLKGGWNLIVNRYSPSNLAYGIAHGLPLKWLINLEEKLPKPDIVLVLDVSPATSFRRKRILRDLHEKNSRYLEGVRKAYLQLAKRFGWIVINGESDAESIHQELWNHVSPLFRKKR